jgi:hypothetical protein
MSDDYRNFILSASSSDLIAQLSLEIKEPLVSSQNLVHILMMILDPSPAMQRKLDSGEIDPAAMLGQITQNLTRALDVLDYYRQTLDNS